MLGDDTDCSLESKIAYSFDVEVKINRDWSFVVSPLFEIVRDFHVYNNRDIQFTRDLLKTIERNELSEVNIEFIIYDYVVGPICG